VRAARFGQCISCGVLLQVVNMPTGMIGRWFFSSLKLVGHRHCSRPGKQPQLYLLCHTVVLLCTGNAPLQAAWGTLKTLRAGLALAVVTCLAIPLPSVPAALGQPWLAALVLYLAMAMKAVAQCSAFTGAMLAANAAPHPSQLGAVNGIGRCGSTYMSGSHIHVLAAT